MKNLSIPTLVSDVARDLASQEVSEGMLGDRTAMHRDVLSRHAKPVLASIGTEHAKSISHRVSTLLSSFWRPQTEGKPKDKCPLRKLI